MYPRSNTTDALSDLSSGQRNSDTLSITSGSDASEDGVYSWIRIYRKEIAINIAMIINLQYYVHKHGIDIE